MAITQYGRRLEPIELPEPQLRPETALLEVLACGLCYSDIKIWDGAMAFSSRLKLPHVPGHEICGRVLAADPRSDLEGATVVVHPIWPCRSCGRCRAGEENLCGDPQSWTGFTHPGGLRERMVVPLDRLTIVPDGVDPVHAAPMACAVGTAYRATITKGAVTAGSRAAIIGLGGVGIHALQLARAAGADAVGFDIAERAVDAARRVGSKAIAIPTVAPAMPAQYQECFDVVVDVVGTSETMDHARQLLRAGGRIVAVGYSARSSFVFDPTRFVLEEVEVVGSRGFQMAELERAMQLVADGAVQIVVDKVTPFEAAFEAYTALAAGAVAGRAVIDVAGAHAPREAAEAASEAEDGTFA